MNKWKCTICGYIHEGDEPPEKCPKCGADRTQFVLVAEEGIIASESARPKGVSVSFESLARAIWKYHVHPISVHIPNGVLPLSVFFVFLASFLRLEGLGIAAFYNMIFVMLAMPVVLFSGYVDWKKRFGGVFNTLFITKMICGGTVLLTSVVSVVWRMLDANIVTTSEGRWAFLLLQMVLLAAAVIAGYCGGKLVFEKNGRFSNPVQSE